MSRVINFKTAVLGVLRAIQRKGADYVYPKTYCRFTDEVGETDDTTFDREHAITTPEAIHCLVGQALSELDIPLPEQELGGARSLADWLEREHMVHVTKKAVAFLERVQANNDNKKSWGAAFTDAFGRTIVAYSDLGSGAAVLNYNPEEQTVTNLCYPSRLFELRTPPTFETPGTIVANTDPAADDV